MHEPEFELLCDGLCELLSVERCEVQRLQGGLRVLRLRVQDMGAYLLHAPSLDEHVASLVVECGALSRADELQGWLDLLDANYALRGSFAPRFSRDPETGYVILQCAFGLAGASAAEVHSRLVEMLCMAQDWRAQHTRNTP